MSATRYLFNSFIFTFKSELFRNEKFSKIGSANVFFEFSFEIIGFFQIKAGDFVLNLYRVENVLLVRL